MTHPTLTARIGITLLRGQNNREHHRVRAKRVAAEREATLAALDDVQWSTDSLEVLATLCEPAVGARVTLVRPYQVTPLDSDNLSASFKAVRDGVAEFLGLDDASDRLHWVYLQSPAVVLGKSTKPGKSRASPDRDTRPTVTIEVLPVDRIDPQAEALAQAEAREWALGVQVVAQAARLRLAESTIGALRDISEQDCPYSDNCPVFGSNHGTCEGCKARRALAAWYAVPGDVAPVDLG